MKEVSNTETELKKSAVYKKPYIACVMDKSLYMFAIRCLKLDWFDDIRSFWMKNANTLLHIKH